MDILHHVLSAVAAVAAFGITVAIIEKLSHKLMPAPSDLRALCKDKVLMKASSKGDATARATLKRAIDAMGFKHKGVIVLGWTLGAGAGSSVGAMLNEPFAPRIALLVAAFNAFGVWFVGRMLPHPRWMSTCGYLLPWAAAVMTAFAWTGCFT